jgi:hypothetical protein
LTFLPLTLKIQLYNPFINALSTLKSLSLKETGTEYSFMVGDGVYRFTGMPKKQKAKASENWNLNSEIRSRSRGSVYRRTYIFLP